jgi:hypothetical protein
MPMMTSANTEVTAEGCGQLQVSRSIVARYLQKTIARSQGRTAIFACFYDKQGAFKMAEKT